MTCIVALETKSGVIMGGDSASAGPADINKSEIKKVYKVGPFLMGGEGSWKQCQLLQYRLSVKKQDSGDSDMRYLATEFVDAVRTCFDDSKYGQVDKEEKSIYRFLVGYNGKVYCVYNDFHVNRFDRGYMAIGCGEEYALGALFNNAHMKPRERIKNSLATAAEFSSAVSSPYVIKRMKARKG